MLVESLVLLSVLQEPSSEQLKREELSLDGESVFGCWNLWNLSKTKSYGSKSAELPGVRSGCW